MNTSKENRLLTSEVLAALANFPFLSQEKKDIPDHLAVVAFRLGALRWYVIEGEKEGDSFTFFALVCGFEERPELGYINADELANVVVDCERFGFPGIKLRAEQVPGFKPCKLSEIQDKDVKAYCSSFL